MQKVLILTLVAALLIAPIGCKTSNTGSWLGTGAGAAAGGLIGGIIGHQTGNKWKGALIGAGVGALAGYIVGTELGASSEPASRNTAEYDEAKVLFDRANRTSDPYEAIALYDRCSEIAPQYPEPYNNKGLQYLKVGNRPMARSSFEQALQAAPGYQPARDNLDRMNAGMM
jgi:tetratricopeptide (TPR) repeat protein